MTTLTIKKGKTLQQIIRWGTLPIIRKPITAIDLSTGAPRLTVTDHGLPNGWRAYCYGIKGTKELNAEDATKIGIKDYYEVTVIDTNTVEFNSVNAANFTPYVSGGFLAWDTPHDLVGYTAEVVIKDKVGGTLLLSSRPTDAPLDLITATVDAEQQTILITIDAAVTAALAWKKGVWEVEMHGLSTVEALITPSTVVVENEVAT